MGGDRRSRTAGSCSGEPVADILVRSSRLRGIEIGGDLVPRAIDEFPAVSVAAAFAEGTTLIRDARELRVKETDRIAAMTSELNRLGGRVEAREDGMVVHGSEELRRRAGVLPRRPPHRHESGGGRLCAPRPGAIDDTVCTATSFPGFWELLEIIKG